MDFSVIKQNWSNNSGKVKVFFNFSDPPDQPLRDLKNLNWYMYLNLGIQIYVLVKIQIFFNSNEFKLTRGPGRGVGGVEGEKKTLTTFEKKTVNSLKNSMLFVMHLSYTTLTDLTLFLQPASNR